MGVMWEYRVRVHIFEPFPYLIHLIGPFSNLTLYFIFFCVDSRVESSTIFVFRLPRNTEIISLKIKLLNL